MWCSPARHGSVIHAVVYATVLQCTSTGVLIVITSATVATTTWRGSEGCHLTVYLHAVTAVKTGMACVTILLVNLNKETVKAPARIGSKPRREKQMDRNWAIFGVAVCLMLAVIGVAEQCNPIPEKQWRRTKNTVERLDKDVDKLKARKCECQK